MNLQAEKQALLHTIAAIEDAAIIRQVKNLLQSITGKSTTPYLAELDWVTLSNEPMPKTIDLDILVREQNYSHQALKTTLQSWDYPLFEDQNLEDLLNSLT
ncbi:MAG: hypothetical protein R3E32_21355 [Chitinophagales bacterium]